MTDNDNKNNEQKQKKNEPRKPYNLTEWIHFHNVNKENTLEISGNTDTKILAKAYEEFSKDGLILSERDQIEKLDNILNNADIVISKTGDKATITQEDGKIFTVKPEGRGH